MGMHLADLGRPTLPCGAAFSGEKRVGESVSIFYSLRSSQIEFLIQAASTFEGLSHITLLPLLWSSDEGQKYLFQRSPRNSVIFHDSSYRKYCTCNQIMLPAIHEPKRQRYAS